jgi:hypothetical protein
MALIVGTNSNDLLLGTPVADRLVGRGDDDRLFGAGGNDVLNGGDDHDVLHGGAGNDRLTGGDDGDRFIFTAGRDVITDFDADEPAHEDGDDVLDLRGIALPDDRVPDRQPQADQVEDQGHDDEGGVVAAAGERTADAERHAHDQTVDEVAADPVRPSRQFAGGAAEVRLSVRLWVARLAVLTRLLAVLSGLLGITGLLLAVLPGLLLPVLVRLLLTVLSRLLRGAVAGLLPVLARLAVLTRLTRLLRGLAVLVRLLAVLPRLLRVLRAVTRRWRRSAHDDPF